MKTTQRFRQLISMLALVHFRNSLGRSFCVAAAGGFSAPSHYAFALSARGGAKHTASLQLDSLARSFSSITSSSDSPKSFRVLQVQIVHRHGDRTPITPLQNETYWASTLPSPALLDKLSASTRLIRDESKPNTHKAGGRGPFGKLTQLGLLQMVELGSTLKQELQCSEEGHATDEHGNVYLHHGCVFHSDLPLVPENIQVI
jgi:hypothetical protein